jgi:hypothetical protein
MDIETTSINYNSQRIRKDDMILTVQIIQF